MTVKRTTNSGTERQVTVPRVPDQPSPPAQPTAKQSTGRKKKPGATRRYHHQAMLAGKIKPKPVLSPREQLFVRAYIATNFNQRKAAEEAGYEGNAQTLTTTAQKLMKRPRVQQAIAVEIQAIAERKHLDLRAERVVQELANLGFSNALDYVELEDDGEGRLVPRVNFVKVGRAEGAAITEISNEIVKTTTIGGEDGEGEPEVQSQISKVKFKLANKESALVKLARHLNVPGFVEASKSAQVNIQMQVNMADVRGRLFGKLVGPGPEPVIDGEAYEVSTVPDDGDEDVDGGEEHDDDQ